VIDPSSEEVYGRSASGTAGDIDGAVAAAKADLPSWGKTTGVEWVKILRAIADAMERNTPELADKEAVNAGKPPSVREDSTSSSFSSLSFVTPTPSHLSPASIRFLCYDIADIFTSLHAVQNINDTSKGQDRLRHDDIKDLVVSLFIRLLYDFRCLPQLKARFLRGRNSCSASFARAGVMHQNGGGELRKGMRRAFVRRRRVLDGLMPRCRGCASFG